MKRRPRGKLTHISESGDMFPGWYFVLRVLPTAAVLRRAGEARSGRIIPCGLPLVVPRAAVKDSGR